MKQIKENPEFLSVLQEQQDARTAYDEAAKRTQLLTSKSVLRTTNGRQKRIDRKILPVKFTVRKMHTMKLEYCIWNWKR